MNSTQKPKTIKEPMMAVGSGNRPPKGYCWQGGPLKRHFPTLVPPKKKEQQ